MGTISLEELLFVYKDKKRTKETTENFEESLKRMDLINDINPFDVVIKGNKPRERKNIVNYLGDRKKYANFSGKTFSELKDKKGEHLIQRHLLFANKVGCYANVLGEIIGYEVPTVYETYPGGIDILSYKDGKLMVVELKDCDLFVDKKIKPESILRALYEVTTYYAYFKSEMEKTEYGDVIKKIIANSEPTIEKVVIVPKDMASKMLEHKELIKDIKVISIEKKEDLSGYKVDEEKELFNLEVLHSPN